MTGFPCAAAAASAVACFVGLTALQANVHSTAPTPPRAIVNGMQSCDDITAPVGVPVAGGREPLVDRCLAGARLGYSEEGRVPLWVAERLGAHNRQVVVERTRATCPFKADNALKTSSHEPAQPTDYTNFGYDRGHMAPAADMTWSEQAMSDSCLMSNIVPQVGVGMNQHIWAELEELVRDWACDFGDVVVITGPVFDIRPPKQIGKANKVHVPTAFFKIVYPVREPRHVVAFLLENRKFDKRGAPAYKVLDGERTSIEAIEQRTGLEFFPGLDPTIREPLVQTRHHMLRRDGGCRNAARAPAATASTAATATSS